MYPILAQAVQWEIAMSKRGVVGRTGQPPLVSRISYTVLPRELGLEHAIVAAVATIDDGVEFVVGVPVDKEAMAE